MSAHAVGLFCVGVEPPPESSEPSSHVVIRLWSLLTAPRSACVICPTFSASVMRESRSRTRCLVVSDVSRYGRPCALMTTIGWPLDSEPPVTVNLSGIVSAVAAPAVALVATVKVRVAPAALPAGKVTVPEPAV